VNRKPETSPRKPGGGRKTKSVNGNRVKKSLYLDPVVMSFLESEAERQGVSLSDALNHAVIVSLPDTAFATSNGSALG
jgi:hypothetical protein